MAIQVLTQDNFTQILAEHELVVVDFSAQWCAPCQSFTKVVEKVAQEHPDVLFGSVDIDKEPELAKDFNIMSVPAVMILKQQVVVYADSGLLMESSLVELIEQAKQLDVSKQGEGE